MVNQNCLHLQFNQRHKPFLHVQKYLISCEFFLQIILKSLCLFFLFLKQRGRVLIKVFDFSSWPSWLRLHHKDTKDSLRITMKLYKSKRCILERRGICFLELRQRSKLLLPLGLWEQLKSTYKP